MVFCQTYEMVPHISTIWLCNHTYQQYDYAITWCLSCGLAGLWLKSTLNSVANECLGMCVCVYVFHFTNDFILFYFLYRLMASIWMAMLIRVGRNFCGSERGAIWSPHSLGCLIILLLEGLSVTNFLFISTFQQYFFFWIGNSCIYIK